MTDVVAILVGGAAGVAAAVPIIYFTARALGRRATNPLSSPPCDRCDKPTERPYLWTNTRLRWHCAACEKWINDQLFQSPNDPGYDRGEHMAFLDAWKNYQADWKRVTSGDQPGPRSTP